MSGSPPKDLSLHVTAASILAAGGVSVKNLAPQVSTCPFCKAPSKLSIYSDPVVAGNCRWLYCASCGFKGDTIEAYGRLKDVSNPTKALRLAIRDGLFDGSLRDTGPAAIKYYVEHFPEKRKIISDYWNQLTNSINNVGPQMVRRTQQEHLWYGLRSQHRERLNQFLGGGTRRDIMSIFKDNHVLPKKGHATNLVLNYQDIPGRTCAFEFLGENGVERTKYFRLKCDTSKRYEGGIGMLEALSAVEGTVFAVNDKRFALHMHSRNFKDWDNPLKLILYNQTTDLSWRSVVADRVVFWSPKVDISIIDQARRVENGWITTYPVAQRNMEEFYKFFWSCPIPDILNRMGNHAKPWKEYVISILLNRKTEESYLRELVNTLQLEAQERKDILDACPRSSRNRLESILSDMQVDQVAFIKNSDVIDKEDGWYSRRTRTGDELISDAKFYIQRELTDPAVTKAYWEGVILFNKAEVPFREEVDVITRNTEKWITDTLLKAKLGTPNIQPAWKKWLVPTARKFSRYRSVVASRKLGIQEDGTIVFPNFSFEHGEINRQGAFMTTVDTPAQKLKPPIPRPTRINDKYNPVVSVYAVIAATYVANFMSQYTDSPKMPVAVIGKPGSLGREVTRLFAQNAGMDIHVLGSKQKVLLDKVREGVKTYGYPAYLDTPYPGLLPNYPVNNTDHVYVGVTADEASALAVGGNWAFIHAPEFNDLGATPPPMNDALCYFLSLQKRDFTLPDSINMVASVMADFLDWYELYLRKPLPKLRADVKRILKFPEMPGIALIQLAARLYKSGYMEIEHNLFMKSGNIAKSSLRTGIVIDDEEGYVFIDRDKLLAIVGEVKLPIPDLRAATANLVAHKKLHTRGSGLDGWIITRSVWDRHAVGYLA